MMGLSDPKLHRGELRKLEAPGWVGAEFAESEERDWGRVATVAPGP